MAQNIVGNIPEFSEDGAGAPERVLEEVKEPVAETPPEEKVTPEPPAEKPDEPIVEDTKEPLPVVDTQALEKAVTGLQEERVKLLKEISELKGQRREIKQDQLARVEQQIDELKDVAPEDVSVVEKILRSKGVITKEEANRMFYENVKQDELDKFLNKYPEFKPENDPSDLNWGALQRELSYYKMPDNPRLIGEVLERARRGVIKVPSERSMPIAAKKRQVEVASAGSGGAQRSSSKELSPELNSLVDTHLSGFSPDEIKSLKSKLSS